MDKLIEKLLTVQAKGSDEGQVVVMAGSPGSGKTFAIKNFTNIENSFKVLDIDEINRLILKSDKLFKRFREWLEKTNSPYAHYSEIELRDDSSIFGDKEFVDTIYQFLTHSKIPHTKLGVFLRVNKDKDSNRLPNVALDTTFGNIDNINRKLDTLIDHGYTAENINLVWVFTSIEEALFNNNTRPRTVDSEYLTKSHKEVFHNIMSNISNKTDGIFDTKIKGNVWVIVNLKGLTKRHKGSDSIKDFYYIHLRDKNGWNTVEMKKFLDWVKMNTDFEV